MAQNGGEISFMEVGQKKKACAPTVSPPGAQNYAFSFVANSGGGTRVVVISK